MSDACYIKTATRTRYEWLAVCTSRILTRILNLVDSIQQQTLRLAEIKVRGKSRVSYDPAPTSSTHHCEILNLETKIKLSRHRLLGAREIGNDVTTNTSGTPKSEHSRSANFFAQIDQEHTHRRLNTDAFSSTRVKDVLGQYVKNSLRISGMCTTHSRLGHS